MGQMGFGLRKLNSYSIIKKISERNTSEKGIARNRMDIKVIVATHKQYRMPSDNCYMPLHVGKQVDFNQYYEFQRRMFGIVSELLLNVWIEQ